jgi:putative ABC transport system permease protein
MQALPGVESASAISDLPLTGNAFDNTFTIPGRPLPPGEFTSAQMRWVSPDYFRTMGIPLLRGRGFTDRDNERSPRTIIISQAMARRYWPGDDPIGKRMVIDFRNAPDFEIVGIAGDVRSGPELEPESHMYVTYSQLPRASMYVALRARGALSSSELAAAVRREVAALDSDVAVYKIRSMEDVMALAVASRRFNMLLLGIFAGLALVLAAVGIYGVMAYAVSQRTHEIGVRMALGAQRRDVMRMLIGQGLVLALIGVAVGLAGAFGVTRVISTLLYGVSATDAPTFAIVSAVLAGVALLASYLPALRATRIQPIVALRYE